MKGMIFYVLCGGGGTRLWPLSTISKPKPFLPIFSGESLFSLTCKRLNGFGGEISVLIQERYKKYILNEIPLLEPSGRNTAPAIALAVLSSETDGVIGFFPADHYFTNLKALNMAVVNAVEIAERENLIVTLGISPTCAHTGYGYIHCQNFENGWGRVSSFSEKPDYEKACDYLRTGNYFWNSGIFFGKRSIFLREMQKYCLNIIHGVKNYFITNNSEIYDSISPISIDYALMEKTDRIAMIPLLDTGWSDVGHFENLYSILPHDEEGNVVIGEAEIKECKKSLIAAVGKKNRITGLNGFVMASSDEGALCRPLDLSLMGGEKQL